MGGAIVPVVRDDAADGGGGAGEKGGMSDGGNGMGANIMRVGVDGAAIEQARKAGVVIVTEAEQVVVTKLIDDDGEDELGLRRGRGGQDREGSGEQGEASHGVLFSRIPGTFRAGCLSNVVEAR